jgi:hypothetical protein
MISFRRVALLLALSACGGNVANGGSPGGAGNPVGGGGGGGASSNPPSTGPAPAPSTCSTLTFSLPAQAVGDGDGARGILASIAAEPDGVLVGVMGVSPFSYPFRVREVGFDGTPLAPGVDLFQDTGFVAAGGGHAGAVGGGQSCSFTALGPDAVPTGKGASLATAPCRPLVATASGFATITDAPSLSLVTTDASGAVTFAGPLTPPTALPMGMAVLPDGSFVLLESDASLSNCECPEPVYAVHVGAGGQALGSRQVVGTTLPGGASAIAAVGSGALVVTSVASAPVSLQPLDGEGNPAGAPVALAAASSGNVARAVDVAAAGGDVAIVTWVEASAYSLPHVVAQAVSSTGAILSQPALAPSPQAAGHVRVAGTPAGALVAWDAPSNSVVAAAVACSR